MNAELAGDRLTVSARPDGDGDTRLDGEMELIDWQQLSSQGDIQLPEPGWLAPLVRDYVNEITGSLSATWQATGTLDQPSVVATVSWRDGGLDVVPSGTSLDAIALNAQLQEQTLTFDVSANSGHRPHRNHRARGRCVYGAARGGGVDGDRRHARKPAGLQGARRQRVVG